MRRPLCARLVPLWLEERCSRGACDFEGAGALYDDWRIYARRHGEEPGSTAEFAALMESLGFPRDQLVGDRRRIRWGLRLRARAVP